MSTLPSDCLRDAGSFRDPCGFVFTHQSMLYRCISHSYQEQYDRLMESGLYRELLQQKTLIEHEEVQVDGVGGEAYKILRPHLVPFFSYPYEWCFSQLKDAALATLNIHKTALGYGMILKDASAYNIQFVRGQAVLIDTSSFDFYREGAPWGAYGQFCRHFLVPLFLMAYTDIRLSQLLRVYIDGVPLDLASKMLPKGGGFAARQHIHWHAKATQRYGDSEGEKKKIVISRFQHVAIVDSLIRIVEKLQLPHIETEWGDYYARTNYTEDASTHKRDIVTEYLKRIAPHTAWDLGANDGTYSRLALEQGVSVTAFDIDPIAVERNYRAVKGKGEDLLPLVQDLTNPSPSMGYASRERKSLAMRQKPDCVMLLAVAHHMVISNNVPFPMLAQWLGELSNYLIIEFIPKEDSQVKKLLQHRDDVFPDYTQDGFETAFGEHFILLEKREIDGSKRTMYLYQVKRRP